MDIQGKDNLKMLLTNPDQYAKSAIECLEQQMITAKGKNKILKLKSRIDKWKTLLTVLNEQEPKLQEIEKKFDESLNSASDTSPTPQELSRKVAEEINSLLLEPDTMKNIETVE